MTNEEALNILYKGIAPNPTANNECIELCKKALEKQIPKKPTPHIVQPVEAPIKIGNGRWQKGTTVYKCPNCKEWVSKTYKYCPDCGQALDFNINGSDSE